MVERAQAEFVEGRVLGASSAGLRVEPIGGGEAFAVGSADAYRWPLAKAELGPAELAICRVGGRWTGCRTAGAAGARRQVVTLGGGSAEIDAGEILAPSALTRLNLDLAFQRAATRSEFLSAVASAGRPWAPPGFQALPRARVIARRREGWFDAEIGEIDDEGAYVVWVADGARDHVARADIVPEPPDATPPVPRSIVLTRPASSADPWRPARVVRLGDPGITISDETQAERVVRARDVLILSP